MPTLQNATPEFCLFAIDWWATCMTKAEWSGWVQAAGSIVAIFAAYFLADQSYKRTKRDERDGALVLALEFGGAFLAVINGVLLTFDKNGPLRILDLKHTLREAAEMGLEVRAGVLPSHLIPSMFHLKTMAKELEEVFEHAEVDGTVPAREYFVTLLTQATASFKSFDPYSKKKSTH